MVEIASLKLQTALLAIGCLLLLSLGRADAQSVISREEIIDRVAENVILSSSLKHGLDEGEQRKLLGSVRRQVAPLAAEILPENLAGSSLDNVERVIRNRLIITRSNTEYNNLRLRKHLMDIKLQLKFQMMVAPMSEQQTRALHQNVEQLVEGMRSSMARHLAEYYTKDEIDEHLDRIKKSLSTKIGDTNTYSLKVTANSQKIEDLLREFNVRLELSRDRVAVRLADVNTVTDVDKATKLKDSIKLRILHEITGKPLEIFLGMTSDPALKAINPENLAPGYSRIIAQLGRIERKMWAEERRVAEERVKVTDQRRREAQVDKLYSRLEFPEVNDSMPSQTGDHVAPKKKFTPDTEKVVPLTQVEKATAARDAHKVQEKPGRSWIVIATGLLGACALVSLITLLAWRRWAKG